MCYNGRRHYSATVKFCWKIIPYRKRISAFHFLLSHKKAIPIESVLIYFYINKYCISSKMNHSINRQQWKEKKLIKITQSEYKWGKHVWWAKFKSLEMLISWTFVQLVNFFSHSFSFTASLFCTETNRDRYKWNTLHIFLPTNFSIVDFFLNIWKGNHKRYGVRRERKRKATSNLSSLVCTFMDC